MIYEEARVENNQIKIVKTRTIDQSKLTSECWGIQIAGIERCKTCEYLDTEECGGKEIRKRLLNK